MTEPTGNVHGDEPTKDEWSVWGGNDDPTTEWKAVPDGNDGITIERKRGDVADVVHIWDNDLIEYMRYVGSKMIVRRLLGDIARMNDGEASEPREVAEAFKELRERWIKAESDNTSSHGRLLALRAQVMAHVHKSTIADMLIAALDENRELKCIINECWAAAELSFDGKPGVAIAGSKRLVEQIEFLSTLARESDGDIQRLCARNKRLHDLLSASGEQPNED